MISRLEKGGRCSITCARRAGAWFLAPALGLALFGCAHAPGSPTRTYPAPAAKDLLAELTTRQRAVDDMNARVRATSWLGGERLRATVNMLVERDGHLRFEAEVSLQGTVATVATDGSAFELLDTRKGELARGPACPRNVASLIRIPLAPADVAAILLGDARLPAVVDAAATAVEWDAATGADALVVREGDGGALRFLFRGPAAPRELVGVARTAATGARLWRTAGEDFETVGGFRLPRLIRFAERDDSFDDGVEIRFKERALEQGAPAGAFTLTAPVGVAVRDIGCGAEP
jgi:hypothetical protein